MASLFNDFQKLLQPIEDFGKSIGFAISGLLKKAGLGDERAKELAGGISLITGMFGQICVTGTLFATWGTVAAFMPLLPFLVLSVPMAAATAASFSFNMGFLKAGIEQSGVRKKTENAEDPVSAETASFFSKATAKSEFKNAVKPDMTVKHAPKTPEAKKSRENRL